MGRRAAPLYWEEGEEDRASERCLAPLAQCVHQMRAILEFAADESTAVEAAR